MKKVRWGKLLTRGRAMYLAYDQGMEHGPSDFDDENVNPLDIIDIAKKGKFNGMVFQKGIAEKYNKEIRKSGVPLILKLNGKTNLFEGEPISPQICSVSLAKKLGARAVGYTVYIGSAHEEEMAREFAKIEKEAHAFGLPVIVWVYPRGKSVKGKSKSKMMAYAARFALESGADMAKINYHGTKKDLAWAVKAAGRCKVVVAGGVKIGEGDLLKQVREVISAGCVGIAVGRNVWQAREPLEVAGKIRGIVFGKV